jgi:hypothetical protein
VSAWIVHLATGGDYAVEPWSVAEKPRVLRRTDQTVRKCVVHELRSGV